jgi:hypothetical protein
MSLFVPIDPLPMEPEYNPEDAYDASIGKQNNLWYGSAFSKRKKIKI